MWHEEREATKACSGSTPGPPAAVGGMFAGAARAGTVMPPSKRSRWLRE